MPTSETLTYDSPRMGGLRRRVSLTGVKAKKKKPRGLRDRLHAMRTTGSFRKC